MRRPWLVWLAAGVAVVAGLAAGLWLWSRPQTRPVATPLVLDWSDAGPIAILDVDGGKLTKVEDEDDVRAATRPLARLDPVTAGAPACPRKFVVAVERENARPVVLFADPDCPRLEVAGQAGGWEAPAAFRTWLRGQVEPAAAGGEPRPDPPPAPPTTPDAAVRAWMAALERGDASGAFALLSTASRTAVGGSAAAWSRRGFGTLRAAWSGWQNADVVLERIFDGAAVVAVAGARAAGGGERQPDAAALALLRESGGWRVSLVGPSISPLEPRPGALVPAGRMRLAAAVRAQRALRAPRLHLDATPLDTAFSGQSLSAVTATAEPDVAAGRRVVTVYAEDAAGMPAALAWTFTATAAGGD